VTRRKKAAGTSGGCRAKQMAAFFQKRRKNFYSFRPVALKQARPSLNKRTALPD
jgi:hypothetical protein